MDSSSLVEVGLPAALFLIMVGMGLTLTGNDFRTLAARPGPILFGTLAQIVLMPLLAVAIALALDLPPVMAVGLVLIGACPGGTTSNLFAFLGRGDVALSIILTVLASLITIVTLPLSVNLAMEHFLGEGTRFSLPVLKTVLTLVVIILVPVLIGMAVRNRRPAWAARGEKLVSLFGLVVLVAVIVGLVAQEGSRMLGYLQAAGPAAALLAVAGMAVALLGGRVLGLSGPAALTVAIELAVKNGTLGLMIALSLLQSPEMSIPAAVYSLLMFVFGFLLAGLGRARLPARPLAV